MVREALFGCAGVAGAQRAGKEALSVGECAAVCFKAGERGSPQKSWINATGQLPSSARHWQQLTTLEPAWLLREVGAW